MLQKLLAASVCVAAAGVLASCGDSSPGVAGAPFAKGADLIVRFRREVDFLRRSDVVDFDDGIEDELDFLAERKVQSNRGEEDENRCVDEKAQRPCGKFAQRNEAFKKAA